MLERPRQWLSCSLVVSLAIGAAWALISYLDKQSRVLPFAEPDELVLIREGSEQETTPVPYANILAWRAREDLFQEVSAFAVRETSLGEKNAEEQVHAMMISGSFFETLGIAPWLGRAFLNEEALSGAPPVVMLSADFWQRHFAGDPHVIGQLLRVGSVERRIIGVVQADFRWFTEFDLVDVLLPLAIPTVSSQPAKHDLVVIARLQPPVSISEAAAALRSTNTETCDHPAFPVALKSVYRTR